MLDEPRDRAVGALGGVSAMTSADPPEKTAASKGQRPASGRPWSGAEEPRGADALKADATAEERVLEEIIHRVIAEGGSVEFAVHGDTRPLLITVVEASGRRWPLPRSDGLTM